MFGLALLFVYVFLLFFFLFFFFCFFFRILITLLGEEGAGLCACHAFVC